MSQLLTQTAKLLPYAKRRRLAQGYATSYHIEPDPEHAELGSVLIVAEVLTPQRQAEEVINLIIRVTRDRYYQTEPDESSAERFEEAIKSVNQELNAYTNRGNGGWIGRMSAVIAVIAGHDLHITQTGSAEAYLYRKDSFSHVSGGLNPTGPHRPASTFANIASGEMQPEDRLLIGTPALFHQMAKPELKALIGDNTPNAAIAKIAEIMEKTDAAERTALIVSEVTTPELLALQLRPTEADEIQVGEPSTPIEAAKVATEPIITQTVSKSRQAAQWAQRFSKHTAAPSLRSSALTAADRLRTFFQWRHSRKVVLAAGIVLLITIIGSTVAVSKLQNVSSLEKKFDQAADEVESAKQALMKNDRTTAQAQLDKAHKTVEELQASKQAANLDKQLATRPQVASLADLANSIDVLLDQAGGIVAITGQKLADLSKFADARPAQIQLAGSTLMLVDSHNNSAIYTYDLIKKAWLKSKADTTKLGSVTASTLASTNDSMYLLTAEPAVWQYKVGDDSLTKLHVSFGDWPKGTSIGSYASNLYILSSDPLQLYKHTPTLGGFSAKTPYFNAAALDYLKHATAITVDGAIYAANDSAVVRFINGKYDQSATALPKTLNSISALISTRSGDELVGINTKLGYIGRFDTSDKVVLSKQYRIKGHQQILAATSDSKGQYYYVVSGNDLLRIAP